MVLLRCASALKNAVQSSAHVRRCINTTAAVTSQPADPIQKMFLEKLQQYSQKSKSTQDGLVEPSAELKKSMEAEKERIARVHGFQPGEDYTKFPEFSFQDPELDSINLKSAS